MIEMEQNSRFHDTNSNGSKDAKRQQFTSKQRMDMYAFCVLELEMHSNKVSIKKQQQAIQKVLYENKKESQKLLNNQQQQLQILPNPPTNNSNSTEPIKIQPQQQAISSSEINTISGSTPTVIVTNNNNINNNINGIVSTTQETQQSMTIVLHQNGNESTQHDNINIDNTNQTQEQQRYQNNNHIVEHQQTKNDCNDSVTEGKTLLQLQQEVAMTRKCYSDYQKTQVLTSSMLRDVQKRFSKYYPDAAIPSRSTIKHVFEKCVNHGTVENIKTPRKATKIPQGDEIEHLLIHEPQLSLRQLAQKLNVSTGTVSRRCKALGLVPESVTIKHQQLATARRQKQIKQLENQNKSAVSIAASTSNDRY